MENFAKVEYRARYEVALRGNHVACLLIMFYIGRLAMPSIRRENVRHATLLFCAEGINVRTKGRGRKKEEMELFGGRCDCRKDEN